MLPGELPDELLAGLSGGADSVALLHLLLARGVRVTAVHVNHGLRGEASDGDEAFVRRLCGELHVPLLTYRADLPDDPGEDAARQARYAFFRQAAEETGVHAIALAHHRDDQAETLLMHLLRGSGLTGLGGMAADTTVGGLRILRPLLTFSRAELRAWLTENGHAWREDATNADPRYLRNALRGEILPRMEAMAPGAAERMAHTAQLLREEDALLDGLAQQMLAGHPGNALPLTALRQEAPAMQRRILRALWSRVCGAGAGERSLSASQTEAFVALIGAKAGASCNLPGNRRGYAGWTHLHLTGEDAPPMPAQPLEDCALLRIRPFDGRVGDGRTHQAIPAAMLPGLTVRTRRAGDWLRPFGSRGRQSLQDYFVNRRVDAPFRDRVPLVCRGSEVLLAGGVGAGDIPKVEAGVEMMLLCWTEDFPWCTTEKHA